MKRLPLVELISRAQSEAAAQPHLAAIRAYNHAMVGELAKCFPLAGCALLDLGASVHGYALEAALAHGVASYDGIDWGITRHWGDDAVEVLGESGQPVARLRHMDAEHLEFPDASFDVLLTLSTFEHFFHPAEVLREMYRVLKPGGAALVTFEPVWTSSGGHHLHHFGAAVSGLVPPWSHLFLTEDQLGAVLARADWPAGAPLDRAQALEWIYRGDGVNRISLPELRAHFAAAPFQIEWSCDLPEDDASARVVAEYVARLTAVPAAELMVRGLSLFLRKPAAPVVA